MTEESRPDINKILFLNLVMMLGTTAMQQLGKIINPAVGKAEVDLPGAQASIDMLSMLKEKSEGNRDEEEDRILNDTLSSLQMNYVETAQAEKEKPAEEKAEGEETTQPEESAETEKPAASEPEADEVEPASDGDLKEPKFHKSYG